MEDLAIHASNNVAKQRVEILSKLGNVFDKLDPVEGLTTEMKSKRQDFVSQLSNKQKELNELKDKICKEVATKNPFDEHINPDTPGDRPEPATAASLLNQSCLTEDSEVRAAEGATSAGILHEKHLYTLFRMVDIILFLTQDCATPGFSMTSSKDHKDCQTDSEWLKESIIS